MNESQHQADGQQISSLRLHFFYIVVILSGCLIIVATRDWTKLEGFTDYLSVSATITSLVLAVLAIIYGFVSSNSTNNFLGSVETSAREMKSVGTELHSMLSKGQDLQAKAQDRNEELHKLIGDLRLTIESLSTRTTSIEGAVESIPTKIDSLRSELLEKATPEKPTSTAKIVEKTRLDKNQLEQFLSLSSIIGIAALKALMEAKMRTKPCNLNAAFQGSIFNSCDYAHGYLVASSCLGIVEFELDSKTKTVSHIAFGENAEALIAAEWERRETSPLEATRSSIKKYMTQIENSFEPPPEQQTA